MITWTYYEDQLHTFLNRIIYFKMYRNIHHIILYKNLLNYLWLKTISLKDIQL